ncbi:hypothetical protein F4560_000962 [Saccharothrix ecbatanensis]|uniref:Uncharacterized protein n=1 Tax=Saccharothrix ecbatanensis TaxID=1105145 RepID=A0A7W9LYT7_9PSEU|nr:hypothetical protein [Saccharothrix ecbatanensis]MBB5801194.1 hypothetical protein [Saccharothrix ecbatanensis]
MNGFVGSSSELIVHCTDDYHIIYAVALVAVALTIAGDTQGFGRQWARLTQVRDNAWLR